MARVNDDRGTGTSFIGSSEGSDKGKKKHN